MPDSQRPPDLCVFQILRNDIIQVFNCFQDAFLLIVTHFKGIFYTDVSRAQFNSVFRTIIPIFHWVLYYYTYFSLGFVINMKFKSY